MNVDHFRKHIVNGKTRIECVINNINKIMLECDSKYIDSVQENYDGFLVLILIVAMKENKDIEINGKVSYKLYFNIIHHIIRLRLMAMECRPS